MAVKTQGTRVYFIDPLDDSIKTLECAISVQGIGGSRDEIEITCLEDLARSYEAGLINPETMTININADPSSASHVRLHQLYVSGDKFDMAIGWSDGSAAPTVGTDDTFDFPAERSFLALYQTFVQNFPFDFSLNAVVTSSVTFKLSGLPTLFPKVP